MTTHTTYRRAGKTTDFPPVSLGIEQPVLLLIALGAGLHERNLHDVKHARIAPVLILTLILRDFLMFPRAYRSNPPDPSAARDLHAGDTATVELARVGEAHETLDGRHG